VPITAAPIAFAASERSRLGIEWEIACVDRRSGELAPAAPDLLARIGPQNGFPHVTTELLTNTVEVVSGPHRRVRDAVAELTHLTERLSDLAEPMGIDLMSAGTHPFSQWFQQRVTPGKPRYDTLIDRTRWWGRQMMIWGVHVHVAVEDRAKVFPIIDGLLTYLPHFQALSASSPFWAGETTGYASNRALMFQQLPTAGLPPQFSDWPQYEAMVADLKHTGVIEELTELRWDIRPSPTWGTIEVRTFDGISTAQEIGALAALTQCLVEHFSRELDAGREVAKLQPWFVRENKWRAARYGMDAIIIRDAGGDERLVTADLDQLLPALAPIADALGCSAQLDGIRDIVRRGASYQRQLGVAADSGGSLKAVVSSLVRELRDGLPTG
jgi:glutamate---cysteine ligase / carboxylate-amine ligase